MRIDDRVALVGSGFLGFDLTDAFDCHMWALDAGDGGWVLFDAGAGRDIYRVLAVCDRDGIPHDRIRDLVLTHAHGDHSGGAAHLRERLPHLRVHALPRTAEIVTTGDEDAISLTAARAAGIYPLDYVYTPCPVDEVHAAGAELHLGDLVLTPIPTPGHSHDHHSWLVAAPGKRYLVSGDALFAGGKLALQSIWDCSVTEAIASVERLAEHEFDALLPGHFVFTMDGARRHVDAALEVIARLGCPPSIF
ncbi:MAG: MBL fold metallo-hydrolase [Actinomycetota bacterium]